MKTRVSYYERKKVKERWNDFSKVKVPVYDEDTSTLRNT